MIISGKVYVEQFKNASYETLIAERKRLIEVLLAFENDFEEGLSDLALEQIPSIEEVYNITNEQLIEITKLIITRFSEIITV